MSLEMWSTLASVGTFVVILATALTAVVQLRHIRLANQLSGLLSAFGMLQDPSVRELLSFVRHDLAEKMKDETFRRSYLQTDWYNVNLYWRLLRDVVTETRRNRPHLFENFEWLAARAQQWVVEHPKGDYPVGEQRMTG